jgi:serine protease inhibitor
MGVEVAALTVFIIIESTPHYEVEVAIDKLFFYILRGRESKVVLFTGHVVDPRLPVKISTNYFFPP